MYAFDSNVSIIYTHKHTVYLYYTRTKSVIHTIIYRRVVVIQSRLQTTIYLIWLNSFWFCFFHATILLFSTLSIRFFVVLVLLPRCYCYCCCLFDFSFLIIVCCSMNEYTYRQIGEHLQCVFRRYLLDIYIYRICIDRERRIKNDSLELVYRSHPIVHFHSFESLRNYSIRYLNHCTKFSFESYRYI